MRTKLLLLILLLPGSLFANNSKISFIYYYAWYGSVDYDGSWFHWQEYNHYPPLDISSAYYPRLGSYSTQDPNIIDQHMRWIARTGIQVVVYSWWGRDDLTHYAAQQLLDVAGKYKLKVSFLIEPYVGRNPKRICDDIDFLLRRFGKHPSVFRMNWPRSEKPLRPMFFIYDPDYPDIDLRHLISKTRAAIEDPIVLFQSTDASLIQRTGANGIFAYEAYQPIEILYPGINNVVRNQGGIFVPAVSPGFNTNRTFNEKSEMHRLRRYGKNYDDWWEQVLAADADFVAVLSFNEWHEGTQIEPARNFALPIGGYLSYEGAYGKKGNEAEMSYLRRTARWIKLFMQN